MPAKRYQALREGKIKAATRERAEGKTSGIRREGGRTGREEKEGPGAAAQRQRSLCSLSISLSPAPRAMDVGFGRNKKEQLEPVRARVTGEHLV